MQISLLCQAVYVGCESCSRPLQQVDSFLCIISKTALLPDFYCILHTQDMNGVYCQCLPCMLKKPGGTHNITKIDLICIHAYNLHVRDA